MQKELSVFQLRPHTVNTILAFDGSGLPILKGPFLGATNIANGLWGYVPTPLIADRDKYLKGDGTWGIVASGGTVNSVDLDLGTAGTDINVDASTRPIILNGTIRLNVPSASQTARGVITIGPTEQVIQGPKRFRSPFLISDSAGLVANTTLDVHALTGMTDTIARFADLSNVNSVRVVLDGTIMLGSTTSFAQIGSSSNIGAPSISGGGLRYFSNDSGHWFITGGHTINSNTQFNFLSSGANLVTAAGVSGIFSRFIPSIASNPTPAASAAYTVIQVRPSISLSTGTTVIRGIDYNPNIIGSTGLTHYGLTVSGTNVFSGFGTTTPTTTLHVVGSLKVDLGSDATGDTYYRNVSGVIVRRAAGTDGFVYTMSGGVPVWAAPSGGGGASPGGATTEVQINNAGAFGGGKIFTPTPGNLTLGDASVAGATKNLSSTGSAAEVSLTLITKSAQANYMDVTIGKLTGTGSGNVGHIVIGANQPSTHTRILAAGTSSVGGSSDLHIRVQGATGSLVNFANAFYLRQTIENDPSGTLGSIVWFIGASGQDTVEQASSTTQVKAFVMQAGLGNATTVDGREIRVIGGTAHSAAGNGNGGGVLIQSGAKRALGSGANGNITLNTVGGNIIFTQALLNDNALTQVVVRDNATGILKYKTVASFTTGLTNTAALNELTNTIVSQGNIGPSGIFIPSAGNVTFGSSGLAGASRTISVAGSAANVALSLSSKGSSGIGLVTGTSGIVSFTNTTNARQFTFSTVATENTINSVGGNLFINATVTYDIYNVAKNYTFTTGPTANFISFKNTGTAREITFNTTAGENRIDSAGANFQLTTNTGVINLTAATAIGLETGNSTVQMYNTINSRQITFSTVATVNTITSVLANLAIDAPVTILTQNPTVDESITTLLTRDGSGNIKRRTFPGLGTSGQVVRVNDGATAFELVNNFIFHRYDDVFAVTAGIDNTLYSNTIPANTWSKDGLVLEVEYVGTSLDISSVGVVKLNLGASNLITFTIPTMTTGGGAVNGIFRINSRLIRRSSTQLKAITTVQLYNLSAPGSNSENLVYYTTLTSFDYTTSKTLTLLGNPIGTNEITANYGIAKLIQIT